MIYPANRENRGYLAFHRPRFEFLLGLVKEQIRGPCRILDIGPSAFTTMLRASLRLRIDSLGLEPEHSSPDGDHYQLNLNDTQDRDRCRRDLGPYDLVVFAEVIEHLFTAPELVLSYVRVLLAARGTLIIQTPNAASLRKRVKLAIGKNPFERIRMDTSNPGHFREYTAKELLDILAKAGFATRRIWRQFYFDARFAHHERGDEQPAALYGSAMNVVNRLLPPFLREGLTILADRI